MLGSSLDESKSQDWPGLRRMTQGKGPFVPNPVLSFTTNPVGCGGSYVPSPNTGHTSTSCLRFLLVPMCPPGALGSRGRDEGNRRKKRGEGDAGQAEEGVEKPQVLGRSEERKGLK